MDKLHNQEYLYHYTNVDSLSLILKNRTIRFNSLNKMDDLQEQISNDKQNFGKFVFVSSWTSEEIESIPMWRMYTPKKNGARIKLPINPFLEYSPTLAEFAKLTNSAYEGDGSTHTNFKTIIPASEIINGEFFLTNYPTENQLFEVKYANEISLLNPTILKIEDGRFSISLSNVGIYKNVYWEFQKEWRYRLMFLPVSAQKLVSEHMNNQSSEMAKLQMRIYAGQASLSFSYYDLIIRDECFNDMSIMLAPDISESAKTFVELLIKEYNPNCYITKSALTNLIQ